MKKIIKSLIKFTGIVIFFVILIRTDFEKLGKVFSDIDIIAILPVYLILLPMNFVISYRWHFLLRKISIKRSYWDNIKLYFSGLLAGIITPGRVGEFYMVFRLSKEGHSKIKGAFTIIFARFFDISLLLFLSGLAVYILLDFTSFNKIINRAIWGSMIIIILILVAVLLFKPLLAGLVKRILMAVFKIEVSVKKILQETKNFNFSLFAKTGILTIIYWFLYFFQIYLIGKFLGINISLVNMLLILALVSLVSSIPITIIGLGTREFTMINTLLIFGVPPEKSLALSLMVYSLIFVNLLFSTVLWSLEHQN